MAVGVAASSSWRMRTLEKFIIRAWPADCWIVTVAVALSMKAARASVPDCIRLTLARLAKIRWLPPSCSYRLRLEGKDLPPWHHLLTGDPDESPQSWDLRQRAGGGERAGGRNRRSAALNSPMAEVLAQAGALRRSWRAEAACASFALRSSRIQTAGYTGPLGEISWCFSSAEQRYWRLAPRSSAPRALAARKRRPLPNV